MIASRGGRPAVLVTGGAGYIGSHAVLALIDSGFQPVVLDDLSTGVRAAVPTDVTFYQGDVDDRELTHRIFDTHGITAVMHFAGSIVVPESISDPIKYYSNNTSKSLILIESCQRHGVGNFVFSSTAAVYGEPSENPVTENTPPHPISPYGASKLMTELMLQDVARSDNRFRPVRLRYFNVAGADPIGRTGQQGPQSTHLIRTAIEVALGRRARLEIFGDDYPTRDGTCERDYIHVSDLASAHVAAVHYLLDGGSPTVMNCGYGHGYTVLEVVDCLQKLTGSTLPISITGRRPGDPPCLISDPSELFRRLNWKPAYADLSEIIGSALRWQDGLGALPERSRSGSLSA